jgi:Flp pilus assembly protein CpaB
MRIRGIAVFVAFLLAAGATLGVFLYVRGVKNDNKTAAASMVQVIVAKHDIPAGTKLDDLITNGDFTQQAIPQDALVPGAVTDLALLQGQTTSTFILEGEQISTARLQGSTQPTGGVLGIPPGFQAVSVALEAQRELNGVLQAGDHVTIYATLTGVAGVTGQQTVVVVPDVKVLGSGAGTGIITLALRPFDSAKVVLAQEQGAVWLSLLPPNQPGVQQGPVTLIQIARPAGITPKTPATP